MTGTMPSKGIPTDDSTVQESGKMSSGDGRQKNHADPSNVNTSKPAMDKVKPGTSSGQQWNHQCVENKTPPKEKQEDGKKIVRTQVSVQISGVEPNNNMNKVELATPGRKLVSSQTLETIPENGNDEVDGCNVGNKILQKSPQVVKKEVKLVVDKKSSPSGQMKSPNKPGHKKEKPPPPIRTFDTKSGVPPPVAKKPIIAKKPTSTTSPGHTTRGKPSGGPRFVSSKELKQEQPEGQKRTSGDEAIWIKQDSISIGSTGSNVVSRQDSTSSVASSGPSMSRQDSLTSTASAAPSITKQDSVISATSAGSTVTTKQDSVTTTAGPVLTKQDSITSVTSAGPTVVRQDSATSSVASGGPSVVSTASMGSLKELISPDSSKEPIDVTVMDNKNSPSSPIVKVVTGNNSSAVGGNSPVDVKCEEKPKKGDDQLVEINVDLLCEGYMQPCSSETMNCNSESQRLLAVDTLPEALEDVSTKSLFVCLFVCIGGVWGRDGYMCCVWGCVYDF